MSGEKIENDFDDLLQSLNGSRMQGRNEEVAKQGREQETELELSMSDSDSSESLEGLISPMVRCPYRLPFRSLFSRIASPSGLFPPPHPQGEWRNPQYGI